MASKKPINIKNFLDHPDREEIVAKLAMDIPEKEINEFLDARYAALGENRYILSEKFLKTFKEEYLDMYNTIKEDAFNMKNYSGNNQEQAKELVNDNTVYQQKLTEFIEKEVDIKVIIKKMVYRIQNRVDEVIDVMNQDTSNLRNDRVLIDWLELLLKTIEKFNPIVNGTGDQIIQNNNINIQIVNEQVGAIHDVIKEILQRLDYETSLEFMALFQDKMQKIDATFKEEKVQHIDTRLDQAKQLEANLKI